MVKLGKILIITDVHGKIREMNQFFHHIIENRKKNIDFVVHLGDFWSGRNFEPNQQEQIRNEFTNLDYFTKFLRPVYHIKGNEDMSQPQKWWMSPNTWLMRDQEPFYLQNWKVFPIHYQMDEDDEGVPLKHPEFSNSDGFDMVLSHRPPLGLLDDTLHYKTHEHLKNTGSPMIRKYYDKLKPSLFIFGHFHYSNYLQTKYGLITCIDKLIRIGGGRNPKFKYSYGLLDPWDQTLEIFWKSRLFFKYSLLDQKMLEVYQFDNRNVYKRGKDIN
jgi:Icc-related predicted phosphoesterase